MSDDALESIAEQQARQTEALEAIAEQLAVQNAVLLEIPIQMEQLRYAITKQYDKTASRKRAAGFVADNALDLSETVDLETARRWPDE
ncbi:hypothetical protein [Halapricum desulfuricans]|nr:hypothetical protein [Halapricum desulfuricans]